jgi:putative hemolysin
MKISIPKKAFFSSIFALSLLSGCGSKQKSDISATIANPASEYCVKKGGKLEIVKDESGEKGVCHLPDGTAVDEWELFRRENPQK